ncbi:MAG: TnpV protein, partial [Clostridia bacterium]|nr:TnpV protein [Clostridia bacterium]
ITYREENGCFYPNLELPKQTNYTIGKYGLLHLDFIKAHRKGRYTSLVSECRLNEYLHKVDLETNELLESIITSLAVERGIDEDLKAHDILCWVAEMNNIKADAEEIVLREVVLI